MKKLAKYLMLALALSTAGAFAQSPPPAADNPSFTQQQLDQMLAPVALYPDALLSQVLMASTYPLEVVEAARWSRDHANSHQSGEAAVLAVGNMNWDPSVKSLVAFPQVLQTMDQKIEWTERMGDAFLSQQPQVMDTVQELRHKAQVAGNLQPSAQMQVQQDGDDIDIAPTNPDLVYVPYYDPTVVYGSWWWPDYPPVFWSPWDSYGWNGDFAWGGGIIIGDGFVFGGWDWHHHHAWINDHHHWFAHGADGQRTWQHDSGHRHGVPYRNDALNREFGRPGVSRDASGQYRGREMPAAYRSAPEHQGRPEANYPQGVGRPYSEQRPHALENVGNGADARNFSARGKQSSQHAALRSAPSRGGSPHR
jgi:hypothetical protein